jgi:hypothetical protein
MIVCKNHFTIVQAALGLRKIGLCTLQLLKSVSNLQTNLGHSQNSLLAAAAVVAELSPSSLPLSMYSHVFSLSFF